MGIGPIGSSAFRTCNSLNGILTSQFHCYPGQIPEHLPVADPLPGNELGLEGHRLVAMNTGRTDTAQSTCLHLLSIRLLIGGDAVYNGIHPYLAETNTESRCEWIATLDRLESLNPRAVIAGHKVPEDQDDPRIIAETRQYLRDFNHLDKATTTAREFDDAMLELYPDRVNPGSLWGGAKAAKQQALSSTKYFWPGQEDPMRMLRKVFAAESYWLNAFASRMSPCRIASSSNPPKPRTSAFGSERFRVHR